jgi:hypothetical protein
VPALRAWLMRTPSKVMGLDGRVLRPSTLEPMTLCRAAYEDGADA